MATLAQPWHHKQPDNYHMDWTMRKAALAHATVRFRYEGKGLPHGWTEGTVLEYHAAGHGCGPHAAMTVLVPWYGRVLVSRDWEVVNEPCTDWVYSRVAPMTDADRDDHRCVPHCPLCPNAPDL